MSKSGKPVSTRAEIWGKKMKQRRNENGQALVMTALSMVVMLGFMALATDVGLLFHSKRNLQIAADAAATAAALDYLYNGSATSAVSAGQAAAAANGTLPLTMSAHRRPFPLPRRPSATCAGSAPANPTLAASALK